ncbi:MAG: DUF2589 domain-containing protein [Desulfobacterales bacterium]|nr:DUF2589 domain-containing protein [Desulfobacterales bacterium]
MAARESLDNLIEGLAGAVVEAQKRIETHQINNFLSFFDRDKRPKKLDILVPSLHPEDGGKDIRYRVPLLPLVASSLLRIKEVEISFDTDLVGIKKEDDSEIGSQILEPDDTGDENQTLSRLKSIDLDMRGSGVFKKQKGSAHVVIKVEGRDISEGMARLIDRLLQAQGDID